jgi:hypothetical protein
MTVAAPSSRVVVAGLPRLTRDLVESAFATFDDITVVGVCSDLEEIGAMVRATAANVVVVGADRSELPDAYAEAIVGRLPPDTMVLPFDGGDVKLVAVRQQCLNLGELSTIELAQAIRRTVGERAGR